MSGCNAHYLVKFPDWDERRALLGAPRGKFLELGVNRWTGVLSVSYQKDPVARIYARDSLLLLGQFDDLFAPELVAAEVMPFIPEVTSLSAERCDLYSSLCLPSESAHEKA